MKCYDSIWLCNIWWPFTINFIATPTPTPARLLCFLILFYFIFYFILSAITKLHNINTRMNNLTRMKTKYYSNKLLYSHVDNNSYFFNLNLTSSICNFYVALQIYAFKPKEF